MHALFRFSLSGAGPRGYRDAFRILARAGFRRVGSPGPVDADATFPAAVLGEVGCSPEGVTRVIFAVLAGAGLRPVAVSGCAFPARPAAEEAARP